MMKSKMIFEEPLFLEDVSKVASLNLPWDILKIRRFWFLGQRD